MTMPTIDIMDLNNKKVGSAELSEDVFAFPYREHLIHESVRNHLASLRRGTHKVKTRAEVSGSGIKPFRQKGTGRARQGGSRPPIHRHGGVVHGPVPRDYSYKVNIKEKKAALKSALSTKLREGRILVVNDLAVEPKTRHLERQIAGLGVEGRTLLVDSFENANLVLASRNHPRMQMVDALNVNVHDVVSYAWIVLSRTALEKLTEVLGS